MIDTEKLILFLIAFFISSLVILASIWILPSQDKTNKVDCFDRYGDKILNQVCEKTIIGMSNNIKIILSFISLIGVLLFNFYLIYVI